MLCHIIIGLLLAIPAHGGRKISAVNEGQKADLLGEVAIIRFVYLFDVLE